MKGFDAAQRAWENQLPPEWDDDEECEHRWFKKGSVNGADFYKCRKCGIVEEM